MKKYLNPLNYASPAFGLANRYSLGHAESFLAPEPDEPLHHTSIFLLGAPALAGILFHHATYRA